MAGEPVRWGYHRLCDQQARRLVRDAGVRRGDLVVDVGAGDGAITRHLVAAGATVVAVELHPGRARLLRDRFAPSAVTVVEADAEDLRLPRRPFAVVANPPFAVTTALLRRLLAPGTRLRRADLVVPAHVARRWSAGDAPAAGRWQRDFDAGVLRRLPSGAFHPAAPPATSVLVIARRAGRIGR